MTAVQDESSAFFQTLSGLGRILAIKLYRLSPVEPPAVPTLPCLDHEAMLHEGIAPHAAAYVLDANAQLHEVVFTPREKRINLDVVSTMHECTPEAHKSFMELLTRRFPDQQISENPVSLLKGDRRVASAVRAQVTLRDVLTGHDFERTQAAVDRLQIISGLMEREARAASWGSRTIMAPLIAFFGLLLLGGFGNETTARWMVAARYAVTVFGLFFLYSGLKAVQLTEMAGHVWKRSAEYGLILRERKRLGQA
jgi:hypothetical protein